jgi:hypothetical protein
VQSTEIDALLQPYFGTVRLGIDGFSLQHVEHTKKLFDILMNQPPYRGLIEEGDEAEGT